ncbi:MAG TPA: hypothetical protein ENK85_08280 [Saprospiraceae bacterium]|nr:hypothetical protein [Saprospiraceae bacterium]
MQAFSPILGRLMVTLGLFLGWSGHLWGQIPILSNQRTIVFSAIEDSICTDSLSLIPSSISIQPIQGQTNLDTSNYDIDGDCIILRKPLPCGKKDSLRLTYRVFPIDLRKPYQWIDSADIGSKLEEIDIAFDLEEKKSTSILPNMKGLDYQGSFARGFTLGNNQSLVLNSSFNLQMAGKIANDLEIRAAITDENIPIQPEGNTQELREFDKIFIQLRKDNSTLTAGDYELKSQNSYFLKYNKKLQGATAQSTIKTGQNQQLNIRGSVAIPKGQFARNNIQPIEGNQGPYALKGNNGERFLIIQSATESVYWDGRLLQRGTDQDYIIDYNRGTVTFTPKNLITKDARIIVEFEYADQQYQKSLMATDVDWTHKNWKMYFSFITNQDSKLTGGAKELTKEQKLILAQAGDNLSQAFTSGIDSIHNFSPEIITYELIDTLGFHQVLRYSTDKSKQLFRARFSAVGDGQGNYIISQAAANGRVYEWVAPDSVTGQLQGSYEPIIPLVAPELQQVFSLGATGEIRKNLSFQSEISLSRKDLNRFSDLDKQNDTGLGGKLVLTHLLPFGKKKTSPSLESKISYEWVASTYQAFNPFRQTEFARDWNINNSLPKSDEILPNFSLKFSQPNWGHIRYDYAGYTQKGSYNGKKHGLSFQLTKGRIRWITNASLLTSNSDKEHTSFFRPRSDLSVNFLKKWAGEPGKIGIIWEQEDNQKTTQLTNNQQDTLSPTSKRFDFYKIYLDFPSGKKFTSGLFAAQRQDYAPGTLVNPSLYHQFLQSTESLDIAWHGKWTTSKKSRLNWQFTRRELKINQPLLTTQKPQNTWLGKLDYFFKLPKNLLSSTTSYELGSGQAPKLEYNYLKVDPGQGSFTWIDRNQDSIPQLDEFEIAPFADQADYLRVSIVTNEFVPTNNIRFNQSFRLNPKQSVAHKKGILKFFGHLSTIHSLRINRRLKVLPDTEAWNPFAKAIDSSLVTTEASIINTLFWNKGNPKIEWQIGQKSSNNKSLLTSGGESRNLEIYFSKLRYRINHSINLNLEAEQGWRQREADLFEQRNFLIFHQKGQMAFTHVFDRRLRNIVSYRLDQKKNNIGTQESLIRQELKWAFTLTGKQKPLSTQRPIRLKADFSIVKINFDGAPSSAVGFTMLEGLRPGQNLLWSLTLDKQLTKSVILSLLYNGRQTGEKSKPVHVGSMQARALF